jgi:hypothetical protein
MKQQNNPASAGGKQGNDPRRNDPTKQDERDNDATRIVPERENREKPVTPPAPGGGNGPGNAGIEEPTSQPPYKRTPTHKPAPVEEPGKQEGSGINKGYNPAVPGNKTDDSRERDDSGNPVMKNYGKGL